MKAVLDHIGIAVADLPAALAFYRDALGLDVEASEDVPTEKVRAHFIPAGGATLELLEATDPSSPIAKYLEKRGPGIHHITLRVADLQTALAKIKAVGGRLIHEQPRPGAEGSLIAFVHPSTAHGVLVELKQSAGIAPSVAGTPESAVRRYKVGELEVLSLCDGFFRLDGGMMFGMVPKALWGPKVSSDDRNRITLSTRPVVVKGVRTMLIDAGLGDKGNPRFRDWYGVDRRYNLDHALAEAGLSAEDIDIVLATHLHFDQAGGFTTRDDSGRLRPRFPRARYVARRGEWEDATHVDDRNHAIYLQDNLIPLRDAGVLDLVDDDQTIMPGVRVRRTGGHTRDHQLVWIESEGQHAICPGDLMPTAAHVTPSWATAIDAFPLETFAAKKALVQEAFAKNALVLLSHDPEMAAGRVTPMDGKFTLAAE